MTYRVARVFFVAFFAFWAMSYLWFYPITNFLWTCNVAFVFAAIGIVAMPRSSLLVSAALCMVVIPDVLWSFDVAVRGLSGKHLVGGTEYIFDNKIPVTVRAASFEHVVLPLMLIWTLVREGYDRRAFRVCAIVIPIVYYASYLLVPPALHTNWVWGLFASRQNWMPGWLYPGVAAVVFVVAFCGLSHLAACRWLPKR